MGYFDGLREGWFKKREDGRYLFSPHGLFGSTYILSEETTRQTKEFLNRWFITLFIIVIISVAFFRAYAFALAPIFILVYEIKIRKLLKNVEKTKEKISLADASKNMAGAMGRTMCLCMLILSLIMTAASFYAIFDTERQLAGIFGVLFFGFGVWLSILWVKHSFSNPRKPKA